MNITTIIEKVVGDLDEKKRWRSYKSRVRQLPPPYRIAVAGLERYLLYFGAIANGDVLIRMVEDLLALFEQSAADGTPIRDVVGADPVEFAEDFLRNYSDGQWINKERARLAEAIERSVMEQSR